MFLWVLLVLVSLLVVAGAAVLGHLALQLARDVRHLGRAIGEAVDGIGRAAADLDDARSRRI